MYRVQRIIGKRQSTNKKGKLEYLVKWQGWDLTQSTWQPMRNLQYVQSLIDQFEKADYKIIEHQQETEWISSVIVIQQPPIVQDSHTLTKPLPFLKVIRPKKINNDEIRSQKVNTIKKSTKTNKKVSKFFNQHEESKTNTSMKQKKISSQTQTTMHPSESDQKKAQKTVKIIGMKKQKKDQDFWYYVIEDGQEKWVNRKYIIQNYPVKLIQFYQQRIIFNS